MTVRKRQNPLPDDDDWLEAGLPPDDPATIVDKNGLAAFTGLTLRDIERLCRDGLPAHGERVRRGSLRFSVPAVVQWLLAQNGDTLEAAKRKERTAMARKRQIEVEQLEGRLVDIETVEKTVTDQVAKLQNELLAIPTRLVAPVEIKDAVRAEIVSAVSRLTLREKFNGARS